MRLEERFTEILRQTEHRFEEYSKDRADKKKLLENGRILAANSVELVRERLSRLRVDPAAAEAMVTEGLSFAPTAPGAADTGDAVALERVLGTNDLIGIVFLEHGLATARAVARIHIRSARGILEGYGTGFMVSPRLLLTNNHVLEAADSAATSWAEFNFEVGGDGQIEPSAFFNLDPDTFFLTDPALDYTLVAVRPSPALADYDWLRLIEEQGKLMVGETVNIIQHPNGEPKQLALRENQVIDELEQFLHYRTDTAPGSSGSPVFNDQWEVVALHHSGVPDRDAQDRILTTDWSVWTLSMVEHRIAWKANEGARISRVVALIKAQRLDAARKALRAELFESEPPTESKSPVDRQQSLSASDIEPDQPSARVKIGDDGTATWSIPLTVTVNVGGEPSRPAEPSASTAPAQPRTPEPEEPPPVDDTELQQALADLAESRTRVYYDADADHAAAEEYYDGIRTNVSARTLFNKLSSLVQATHERNFRYKPSRHVYPWIDLHPDLKIRSIYSGSGFDPEELIREDFRIDQERTRRFRELMLREASLSEERMELELSFLEASLPYNCEHVVPQSWYQKKEPMRGDLHHLFACESGCNSFRSNIPYYDFPDFEEAVRDACGKRMGDDKFEPAHGKGAVARAVLYFLLRYPGHIGDEAREMQKDRLPALLEWHNAFPVDEYERHRNAAVCEKQGNRNPLIDRPEWAEKIDFSQGVN